MNHCGIQTIETERLILRRFEISDAEAIECSQDGENFTQMRICHMWEGAGTISFGVYACSPEDSSFKAVFTDIKMMECQWLAHDGQQPD